MNCKDKDIPEEIDTTLYVCICTSNEYDWMIGEIKIVEDNLEEKYDDEDSATTYKLLGSVNIKIPLCSKNVDFTGDQVKGLEVQKENELAEHHMKMKEFQDRIDNLLAIEYKPEGVV